MDIISFGKIFLMAMTPIGELRLAIPVGLTVYGTDPVLTYLVSVSGNILAVFLILTLLGWTSRWLSKTFYPFNRFFAWLFSRTRRNHSFRVQKYGLYILPLFVAIPLPITGGWTASLVAFVFDIPFKKAFPLIVLGILIAGIIVSLITNTGIVIQKYFGWQAFFGVALAVGASYVIYNKIKNNNGKRYEF